MDKRWLKVLKKAILPVMLMALIASVPVGAQPGGGLYTDFSDVSVNWSYKHISKLALLGVISGRGDGTFAPNDPVTHQEVLIMATQLMGMDDRDAEESGIDVLPDEMEVSEWAKGYVSLALRNGLINIDEERAAINNSNSTQGWGSTPATREWVAKIVVRAAGKQAEADLLADQMVPFNDRELITPGFEGYINAAVQLDIVSGMPGNVFNPTDRVTRAQMAVFLSRAEAYMDKLSDRVMIGSIVDIGDETIILESDDGTKAEYRLHPTIRYFSVEVNDNTVSRDLFRPYTRVYAIHDGESVYYLERLEESDVQIETVKGMLVDVDTDWQEMMIWVDGKYEIYEWSSDVKVTGVNNESLDVDDLTANSEIEVVLNRTSKEVIEIRVKSVPVNKNSAGILREDAPEETLVVLDEYSGEEEEYPVAVDATVEYRGKNILLTDLKKGDEIEYRVENGVVTRIVLIEPVEPLMEMVEGRLELMDPEDRVMTIRTEEGLAAYDISEDVRVVLPGKPSARLTDLERGDRVRLSINESGGNIVERIEVLDRSIRMVAKATVIHFDPKRKWITVEMPDTKNVQSFQINNDTTVEQITDWDEDLIESIYTPERKVDLTFTNQKLVRIALSSHYDGTIASIDHANRKLVLSNHDFGELEFSWTTSTVMESGRTQGTIADFLIGDRVRVTLDGAQNHAGRIQLMRQSAYRLIDVIAQSRELLVQDGNEIKRIRLSSSTPVIYGERRNAALNDLPRDRTLLVSYIGNTPVSVEVPSVEYGRIVTAQSTQGVVIETLDGRTLTYEADALQGVRREGTTRVGNLNELRANDRVEIAVDTDGRFWATVLTRTERSFWKYDAKEQTVSFYRKQISEENEFKLYDRAYIHKGTESIRIQDLKDRDDVAIWHLHGMVIEIEKLSN